MREIREKSGFQFSRGAGQRPLGTAHSAQAFENNGAPIIRTSLDRLQSQLGRRFYRFKAILTRLFISTASPRQYALT